LVEVGVPVEEEQAVAPAPPQRERAPEQDAAVAADHDRELAAVEHRPDGVGEPQRVVAKADRVEHPGRRIDPRVKGRGSQPAGTSSPEPLGQTRREQGIGQGLDPLCAQAETRWRLDDRVACDEHLRLETPRSRAPGLTAVLSPTIRVTGYRLESLVAAVSTACSAD
jgi:hypothetical protein